VTGFGETLWIETGPVLLFHDLEYVLLKLNRLQPGRWLEESVLLRSKNRLPCWQLGSLEIRGRLSRREEKFHGGE